METFEGARLEEERVGGEVAVEMDAHVDVHLEIAAPPLGVGVDTSYGCLCLRFCFLREELLAVVALRREHDLVLERHERLRAHLAHMRSSRLVLRHANAQRSRRQRQRLNTIC